MGKWILILSLFPISIFAEPYIKKQTQKEFNLSKVVAVIDGVKAKVAVVKTESGYSIILLKQK